MYLSLSSRSTSLQTVLRGLAMYRSRRFWWRFRVMMANFSGSRVKRMRGMYPSSSTGTSILRMTRLLMSNVWTLTFELASPVLGYLYS